MSEETLQQRYQTQLEAAGVSTDLALQTAQILVQDQTVPRSEKDQAIVQQAHSQMES